MDVDGHLVHRLHDVRRAEADRPLVRRPRGGGVVHAAGRRRDPPGRSARAALVDDAAADEAVHAAQHGRAARPDPRITASIPRATASSNLRQQQFLGFGLRRPSGQAVAPVRDERLKPAAAARQARPSEAAGGERRPAAAEGEKSGLPGQWGFADPSDREEAD